MSLAPGTRLGPYEILGPLGAGAMGEVYRARDPRIGRDVAVKVLPAVHASDPDRLARFEIEARAAGALNHPAVLTLFDVGHEGGAPYVVSELLEGATLRERLAQGPLPPARAAGWMAEAARGLAAAHARGIVHRDLKPENLFVTRDGRLKILDFGLAKLTERAGGPAPNEDAATLAASLTETGMILGTAGYMAPEQVRGEPAGPAADLFALGAILHECLSGARAFRGTSAMDSIVAILQREPAPLPDSVPPALRRIVTHALEKEPERRFQSAADLAFALESVAAGDAATVAPEAAAAATAPRGRGPLASPLALALAALAGVALGAAGLALLRPEPEPRPVRLESIGTSGDESYPSFSPDGTMLAFGSARDGDQRVWLRDLKTGNEAPIGPPGSGTPRFSPDGRELAIGIENASGLSVHRLPIVGGSPRKVLDGAFAPDWSPDGRQLVCIAFDGLPNDGRPQRLVVVDADGGQPRTLFSPAIEGVYLGDPRWSPDGRAIACYVTRRQSGAGNWILVVDPSGARLDSISSPIPTGRLGGFEWTGEPGVLALVLHERETGPAASSPGSIALRRIGRPGLRTVLHSPTAIPEFDVGADGELAFVTRPVRQHLVEYPLDGGAPRVLTQGDVVDRQPTYTRDGRALLFTSARRGNNDIWMLDLETRALTRIADDPAQDWDPFALPDGRRFLFSSNRTGAYEIWIANLDGTGARQLSRDSVDAENPVASSDGSRYFYSSGNPAHPGIWSMNPDGGDARRLVAAQTLFPELSPDGSVLAYRLSRNEIGFVRPGDGTPLGSHITAFAARGFDADLARLRWIPGGWTLAYTGRIGDGPSGILSQPFVPGRSTDSERRYLVKPPGGAIAESFGFSPDGRSVAVSVRTTTRVLMLARDVPGLRGHRTKGAATR